MIDASEMQRQLFQLSPAASWQPLLTVVRYAGGTEESVLELWAERDTGLTRYLRAASRKLQGRLSSRNNGATSHSFSSSPPPILFPPYIFTHFSPRFFHFLISFPNVQPHLRYQEASPEIQLLGYSRWLNSVSSHSGSKSSQAAKQSWIFS